MSKICSVLFFFFLHELKITNAGQEEIMSY